MLKLMIAIISFLINFFSSGILVNGMVCMIFCMVFWFGSGIVMKYLIGTLHFLPSFCTPSSRFSHHVINNTNVVNRT